MIDQLDGVPLTHHTVHLPHASGVRGGLSLHVVTAGPDTGTPVMLLHGFPDFWYGWKRHIPLLAKAGYRVIVPDQRGYAESDKPRATKAYRLEHLADDVRDLLAHFNAGAAHIVGHDWGGGVGWAFNVRHPQLVRTFTVFNCPQPRVLRDAPRTDVRQLFRSWYILFFQIPWLPARVLAGGMAMRGLVSWSRPGTFSEADLAEYRKVYTVDTMDAALRWYKAAAFHAGPEGPVHAPTLMVWGSKDPALGESLGPKSLEVCRDSRLETLPDVGHWTPHDAPERTGALLCAHLKAHGGPDPYVYKIVKTEDWDAAPDLWEGAPVDVADGFVHLSARSQVWGTLTKHFAGQEGLELVAIDLGKCPEGSVKWEVSRGGERFPHVYGGLEKAAAVTRIAITSDGAGGFVGLAGFGAGRNEDVQSKQR